MIGQGDILAQGSPKQKVNKDNVVEYIIDNKARFMAEGVTLEKYMKMLDGVFPSMQLRKRMFQ